MSLSVKDAEGVMRGDGVVIEKKDQMYDSRN